jgi:UDP-3-O-[3-hydroxymyristoyl] glucosamine N-acyltransferase
MVHRFFLELSAMNHEPEFSFMTFTAVQIAALVNGKIEGDANAVVGSFGKIEEAKEGQLAFLANPKYEEYLYTTKASIIIINDTLELKQPVAAALIRMGSQVIIHAGTVIGSDGFGFAPQADGSFQKVPQIGNVVIEDNVEIGANTTIDRATIGSTIIRAGAKLDNLIQVAHNVELGSSTVVAAQAGISGSTKVGKGVMIGGQAGLVGHINIGDGAKINAQSGVSKSIEPGKAVTGSPAYDYTSALRSQAISRNLPELEKRVKELEVLVKQLLSEKTSY